MGELEGRGRREEDEEAGGWHSRHRLLLAGCGSMLAAVCDLEGHNEATKRREEERLGRQRGR